MTMMMMRIVKRIFFITLLINLLICCVDCEKYGKYRGSPKLRGPLKFQHAHDDPLLNQLDKSLNEISTIYIKALLSRSHTNELAIQMRTLEIELFDLLDALYKEDRINDYMRYETEVTRQMIIYNMLKKLFGYANDVDGYGDDDVVVDHAETIEGAKRFNYP